MKKYWKSRHYREFNRQRAAKSLKQKLRFRKQRKQRRKRRNSRPKALRKFYEDRRQAGYRKVIHAPRILSMISNPVEMAQFIGALEDCISKRKTVWVSLAGVEHVGEDGIVVLLSVMIRFKALRISFNGDKPIRPEASAELEQTGFLKNLFEGRFDEQPAYEILEGDIVQTYADTTVDAAIGKTVIDSASQTVWGEPRRCQGVQRVLVELMHNTIDHAAPKGEKEKHWWLSVRHDHEQNKVAFSFLDYGVGIFTSLRGKKRGTTFFNALNFLRSALTEGTDSEVLKKILQGELHRTVTKQLFRGKGLPGIYQAARKGDLSKLTIMTNNVFYDIDRDFSLDFSCDFSGTFVYWEIHPQSNSVKNAS